MKYLLWLFIPAVAFCQLWTVPQTGIKKTMVRGDFTVLSWEIPGDYSADSLELKVKNSASPDADPVIFKATNGDGITVSYDSYSTVLCSMYVYDTQAFTAATYYYDIYSVTDTTTLTIGTLNIIPDVGTRIDGTVADAVPVYTVALDTPNASPSFPIGQDSDNGWYVVNAEAFMDTITPYIDTLDASKVVFTGDSVGIRGKLDVDGNVRIEAVLDVYNAPNSFYVGTNEVYATSQTVSLGDWEGDNNNTYMQVTDSNQRIIMNSDSVGIRGNLDVDGTVLNFINMPSDSTGLSTGDLWFNLSTGAVYRKF